MKPLRWGILSTAAIGVRRVIPAVLKTEHNVVLAVASRSLARARDVASRFDIPRAYGSYEELLGDAEVEAVYNPLPNSLHARWTSRLAKAGKHVLCEKPLALNAQEAQAMADACRAAGVILQEAFMYRFHPQIERLRRLIAEGIVGPVWLVRSAFSFRVRSTDDIRLDADLGGGGLLDVGCYCVNISRLLLGEPERASAAAEYEQGVDVRFAGMLHFPKGGVALFDCGLRAPHRQFCEVIGPEGAITLPRPFQPEEDPALLLLRRVEGDQKIVVGAANQYSQILEHFAACVRGEQAPRYSSEDAVANMRALDMLREAVPRAAASLY